MLARLARASPVWIVMSAAWIAATLALAGLGLYYLATGARAFGESLFVLLAGVGGFTAYLYLRRLFRRAAAADRAAGRPSPSENTRAAVCRKTGRSSRQTSIG